MDTVQPVLESAGLRAGKDFDLAFSPERVDPGNATSLRASSTRTRPTCRIWGAVVALATAAQTAWIIAFDALGKQRGTGVHEPASELFRTAFGMSTSTYLQMIGKFGWLDTPAPVITYLLCTMMLGGLVDLALVAGGRRQCVALVGLLGAVALVPPVIEAAKAHEVGFTWQGRYTMRLAVGVPILAGLTVATSKRRLVSLDRTRLLLLATVAPFIARFFATFRTCAEHGGSRRTIGSGGTPTGRRFSPCGS